MGFERTYSAFNSWSKKLFVKTDGGLSSHYNVINLKKTNLHSIVDKGICH